MESGSSGQVLLALEVRRVRLKHERFATLNQRAARNPGAPAQGAQPQAGRPGRDGAGGPGISPAAPIAARRKTQARKVRTPRSGGGGKCPADDHRERDRVARGASVSHLLDVNFLIACGWESHAVYIRASRWLSHAKSFATCPISEMAFSESV